MSTQWRRHSSSHRELLIFILLVLAFLIAASVTLTGCGNEQADTSAQLKRSPVETYYGEAISHLVPSSAGPGILLSSTDLA